VHHLKTLKVTVLSLPQAGNVVTGEMVEELILAGADIIKVGIGPGDVFTRVTLAHCGFAGSSVLIPLLQLIELGS
jgi:IMP dehydrogenase/GMP reductase